MAQGCSQKHQSNYDETFSPLVRFESVKTVLALAAQHGLKVNQMDVTTALNWRRKSIRSSPLVLRSRIKSIKCAN